MIIKLMWSYGHYVSHLFYYFSKKKSWFDIKTPEMEMSKMIVWLDI